MQGDLRVVAARWRRRRVLSTSEADPRAPGSVAADSLWRGPYARLVVGIFATMFLVAFEAMAVAAAMPVVARSLGGLEHYAWAFSAFLVTSLVAMVAAGEVADHLGPRRPLLAGVTTFVAGLAVAGLAPSMALLVAGRAVQGIGAGFVIVSLYVVVARAFDDAMRPRVFALTAAAWVLPSVIGPPLAGWVAEAATWRLVFLGIVPLVIPAVGLMAGRLRTYDGRAADSDDRLAARGTRRVGYAVVAAVGVALLQLAGSELVWTSALLALGGLLLLLPSLRRLLPRGALRMARGLPSSVVMRGVLAAAFFGAETFVPLMLVELRGLPATASGLSLTSGALGWSAGSWFQSRPWQPLSRPGLVRVGAVLVTVGIGGLLAIVEWGLPAWAIAVAWTVAGAGMGLGMTTVSVLVMQQSPPADQGANSAALQISDSSLSVLAIGLGGTVLAAGGAAAAGAGTYALIFVIMAVIGALGVVAAPRVRTPGPSPPVG